jgi:methionyl-tRNA formyltransferase
VRTVYLGTSDFAATVLRRLAASPHAPALVVTPPDSRQGRGRKVSPPPVAELAKERGMELLQAASVNEEDALARIRAAAPEAILVCAFGQLIKEPLLSEFPMINVHPSLLPRWRGAAPIQRAMMAGDERTGVTILTLTAELDSGPIAFVGEEPIAPDDTYGTLAPRLQELGATLLIRTLDERPDFLEQTEDGVTYAEKIGPEDRTLDPDAPAEVNDRVVRALSPHIGARAALPDGAMLGVLRARVLDPAASGPLRADGARLVLGGLELLEVQPPGGRPMDAAAFLRGHAL